MSTSDGSPDEPKDKAADDVEEELSNIGRELSAVASTRPLWGTAINAQLQEAITKLATAQFRTSELEFAMQRFREQIATIAAVDTQRLLSSINAASGSRRLHDSLRLQFAPSFRAFTQAATYANPDPAKASYSPAMTSPGAYFANHEVEIHSFDELNRKISSLIGKTGELQLVWRGQRNANWGVHSALYRRLMSENRVQPPESNPTGEQLYPTEDQMIDAEREILDTARANWRFDGMSGLETFARIQHAGGPTRLIDITKNPFIAAWFAVEKSQKDDEDGRLIAFATTPVANGRGDHFVPTVIQLDEEWGSRTPPWIQWATSSARQGVEWGTGACRRLWVPPAYDPRIASQNAGFLLDGVPIVTSKTRPYFRSSKSKDATQTYWTRSDILAAGSVFAKTFSPSRKPKANQHNLAPTFTFRIKREAKAEIRDFLIQRFGYTRSYIYPDMNALAEYVSTMDLPQMR